MVAIARLRRAVEQMLCRLLFQVWNAVETNAKLVVLKLRITLDELEIHRLSALQTRGKDFIPQQSHFVAGPMIGVMNAINSAFGNSHASSEDRLLCMATRISRHWENVTAGLTHSLPPARAMLVDGKIP